MYLSIHLFHYIDGSSSELSSFFTNIITPKNIISIPTRTFNIFEILSGINCDSMVPSIATIDKNIKVAETNPTFLAVLNTIKHIDPTAICNNSPNFNPLNYFLIIYHISSLAYYLSSAGESTFFFKKDNFVSDIIMDVKIIIQPTTILIVTTSCKNITDKIVPNKDSVDKIKADLVCSTLD